MSRFVLTAQLQLQAPNNVAQVVRQIQSQLNNVQVNVQVQGAQTAQRQIQQLTRQTGDATTAAERMGRAFAISVRRFAAFSIATRAVSLFTSTLSDAVKTAIDFEREMVRVSQVTGDSLAKLKSFSKVVTDLSTGFGVASSDILQAGQLILQAGFSAKDTEVALKSLAKAALAPNFDSLSETTEGAIAILAQFGEGVGALEKQLGSINAVAGAFAVEAGDLIDVIRRAGGVFKSSGGDLNELIALFTSVRATTRESAESIGTGLRTIFTRIQRPKTIEYLKQFGVELVDLEGKFVGPFEAVRRLSEALSGLGEGDVTFIRIAEELGGFRQIGKVLPLLQQFSVAQSALNVANKAGNSLTQDAATAQQALAVRITKVREEFLALIRSVTETSTFQIMANTALTLASALIKVADAIKPLLPLLTALTAIRIARGLGSFVGSFAGGLSSSRTFNKGGKVHHFARGGMVPGSGNRDTVPAMLQPGEFVIRKSSVNKLGAGNLAAMNENKFQGGTTGRGIVGATSKLKSTGKRKDAYGPKEFTPGQGSLQFDVVPGQIGAFVLTPPKGSEGGYTATQPYNFVLPPTNRYAKIAASQAGLTPEDIKAGINASINPATYPVFYPGLTEGRTNLQKNAKYASAVTKGFNDAISAGVNSTIQSVSSQGLLDIPPALNTDENLLKRTIGQIQSDNQVRSSIEGYLFEAMISAFTGASAAGGRANFDFPRSAISQNKDKLATLFGSPEGINKLIKAEAKRSYGEVGGNIQRKLANDIVAGFKGGITLRTSGSRKQMASGGGVGTDTVPALLTPGEFVVNRKSAQSIGYGALNRMNKVGKYAKGGIVQRFQAGGMADASSRYGAGFIGSGGLDPSQSFIPSNLLTKQAQSLSQLTAATQQTTQSQTVYYTTTQQATQAQQQNTRSIAQSVAQNKLFAATMATSLIQGFLPAIDENSGALLRVTNSMLSLTTTVLATATAVQAFGLSLTAKNIMEFFGSGPKSIGGLLTKGLKSIPSLNRTKIGGGINKFGESITGSIGTVISRGKSAIGSSSFGRGFAGARQGINPLFSAAMPSGTARMPQGTMAVQQLQTRIGGLGVGGRLSARAGGFAGNITNAFQGSNFGRGISAGLSGKSVIGGGSRSIMGNLGGFLGQGAFQAGGIKRGLVSGFQGGRFGQSGADIASKLASRGVGQAGQVAAKFANVLGKGVTLLPKLLGPMAAVGASAFAASEAFKTVIGAVYNFEGRLQTAIESGNVEKASAIAGQRADFEGANVVRAGGATAGAVIGTFFGGPIGSAIGAAIGAGLGTLVANILPTEALDTLNVMFGGNTRASAIALAASQAGAVKTQKALEQAQKAATNAMEDFENGTITASEALSKVRAATEEVKSQEKRSGDFATKNLQNRGGLSRDIFTLGGLLGETSSQRNERLGKESADQIKQASKFQAEAFQMESPARQAMIRSGFARGRSRSEIEREAVGGLQERARQQRMLGISLQQAGDEQGASAAFESAKQLDEQIKQVNRELINLEKEVARSKAAFDAMNLGLRGAEATSSAMSASMTRFASSFEVGGSTFVSDAEFLKEAVTSAAQAMDPADIKNAVSNVADNLSKMGVSPQFVTKFQDNTNAFVQAQQKYGEAFANIRKRIGEKDFRALSPEKFQKELATELSNLVGGPGKENLRKAIEGIKLDPAEVDQILAGNFDVFGEKLGQAQQEQIEKIVKIAQERQKAEQVIIDLTKRRIDAERKLVEAQQEALDLYLEGREVQAGAGGRAVTEGERRGVILGKANAQGDRLGLTGLRTGSAAELRRRNVEMAVGAARFEQRARTEGGLQGAGGVEASEAQRDLQQAYKQQVDTIRSLIKLEQEELKIIQEKNKLEKESLESLITGDIEKFFEQQAAVGATAAIATGNETVMRAFGPKALGDAFKNIQRQQEAGVQSLFGMELSGAGGLLERGATAALSARGVENLGAARTLAGTSPEEEARKARIRELGGVLSETGQVGVDMARMELNTAEIIVSQANIKLQEITERGVSAAANMYRGGVVYANNGMFVPRGTDTVPAMLTRGEFVVNRGAVNRGNNLQILQAMNNGANSAGMSKGGRVSYYNKGGKVNYLQNGGQASAASGPSIDPKIVSDLSNALNNFNIQLKQNITSLQNTKFQIKLDATSINVNLSGGSFLQGLTQKLKEDLLKEVGREIASYKFGMGGNLIKNSSVLNT